jgi:hypothetical protein
VLEGIFVIFTEHLISDREKYDCYTKAPPVSSCLMGLNPGVLLVPCEDEPTAHVLRGIYNDFQEARDFHELMHEIGWEAWLEKANQIKDDWNIVLPAPTTHSEKP